MKTKIRIYGDKVYTNFCSLNVPKYDIEYQPFTVISINSILVYQNKYYLQLYLNNCTNKIVDKGMIDCLGKNPFETDKC